MAEDGKGLAAAVSSGYAIYTFPLIAALIGWFTNYIAVKMLFHPRKKVRILFFELQGIFPKKHRILAEKIGRLVARDLLSAQDIRQMIIRPQNMAQISGNVERKLENYLNHTLPAKYPVLAYFIRPKTRQKIKSAVMGEFQSMAPEMMDQTMAQLEGSLNIEEFIRLRVEKFSTERMESLILGVLASEFRFIEYVGGVLGFFIGVVQIMLIKFF